MDINYITKELTNLGWDYKDNQFYSDDRRFIADVYYDKDDDVYIIDIALLRLFDRWANSGKRISFKSINEVIKFFKSGKYITYAFKEALDIIEDYLSGDSARVLMNAIIDRATVWINKGW